VIANLALDGLETLLKAHYPPNTKRAQRAKVNLVRYADDFIITGSSHELLEHEVKPLVVQFLGERGWNFLQRKPTSPRLRTASISWDSISASTRGNCSSNLPARIYKDSSGTCGNGEGETSKPRRAS